jgi:hypothetical protein
MTPTDIPPLRRDIRSPGAWKYFANYLLLGSSALIILLDMIETGAWRRLWFAVLFICVAMGELASLQAAERKRAKTGASPHGGQAEPPGNSGGRGGPPSGS